MCRQVFTVFVPVLEHLKLTDKKLVKIPISGKIIGLLQLLEMNMLAFHALLAEDKPIL